MWSRFDTNEQLVCYLQQHDDGLAFEELFRRFNPLHQKFCRQYDISSFSLADYYQEGRIVLHRAIVNFNPQRQTHFAHYYQLLYKNHIYNLIRRDLSQKRRMSKLTVSYEVRLPMNYSKTTKLSGLDITRQTLCDDPEAWLLVRETMETYTTSLSELERNVFKKMMEGKEIPMIAQELKEPVNRIRNAYDRCRQKLKKALKDLPVN